ncbi:MAG: hypothetical protein WBC91_03260 [Phototrophicaceae bacterium]
MNKSAPLKFYQRDDGILVFEFFVLHKPAADLFERIVLAGMDNQPQKIRVMYDFSQSPPPTPYFLKIQGKLYNDFPHPPDEKSAYVTNRQTSDVWVNIIRSYLTAKDVMRTFISQDAAIQWLLED